MPLQVQPEARFCGPTGREAPPLRCHTHWPALGAGQRVRDSPVRLPASGSALRLAVAMRRPVSGNRGETAGAAGSERPAGYRAEVRASGRARGERDSGGRPRAPGTASGAGPLRPLPWPQAGPPWAPPSWRAGPASQTALSVHGRSVWPVQRCTRCPPAPSDPQPLGGAISSRSGGKRSSGSRFRGTWGRTRECNNNN